MTVVERFNSAHKYICQHYQVSLPRKPEMYLGESKLLAVKRFLDIERSLHKKRTWDSFKAAVEECMTLGHAELGSLIPLNETSLHYYLPMHPVYK